MEWSDEIEQKMLAPFEPHEIELREGGGGRKLAYIDARTARRRLTDAAGPGSWSFDWELIDAVPEKYVRVKGTMTVLGVTRCDAGEAQFNPRSPDQELVKAAVSDALKRCAVCFGVGAMLYELRPGTAVTRETIAQAARLAGWRGVVPAGNGREQRGAPSEQPGGAASAAPPEHPPAPPVDEERKTLFKISGDAYQAAYPDAKEHTKEAFSAKCAAILHCDPGHIAKMTAEEMRTVIAAFRRVAEERREEQAQRQEAEQPGADTPPAERAPAPEPAPEVASDSAGPVCSMPHCGKSLTQSQYETSRVAFNRPLCAQHQRQVARTG